MAYQVLSPDLLSKYKPTDYQKVGGAIVLKPGVTPIMGTTKPIPDSAATANPAPSMPSDVDKTTGKFDPNTLGVTTQPRNAPVPVNPFQWPDASIMGLAMNQIRTKLSANQDLVNQKSMILKHLYDTPLTPDDLKLLSPSQVSAINSNNRQLVDTEVRLINDQLQNRTQTLDTSINYITSIYQAEQTQAQTRYNDALQTVKDFVTQYGSNAPAALQSLYGPEAIQQMKNMGINIDQMAAIPTVGETKAALTYQLGESKISAQYGTSSGGLDISIPGDTLAGKNNNPGNLRFTGQAGASQGVGGFARFDTPQAGFEAMVSDLTYKMTGQSKNAIPDGPNKGKKLSASSPLEDLIRIYAPSADSNDPQGYANTVANALGITKDTPLSQIDPIDLATAMAKHESGTVVSVSQSDSTINATMLTTGEMVPSMISAYGGARNRAIAEAKRLDPAFNPVKAESSWKASQKWIATQNSSQMVRFYGLATSVVNTIDEVNAKAKEMKLSGIPVMNKAKLDAYIQLQGNSPQGQLATQYRTAVNTLKEEFANLANGGYAPTDAAWDLANSQVNGNYGMDQLTASLTEVQRLINFRVNALKEVAPQVPGQVNTTGAPTTGTPSAGVTPESGVKSVNDALFQAALHDPKLKSSIVTSKKAVKGKTITREQAAAGLKKSFPLVSPAKIDAIIYATYPNNYN